MFCAKLGTDFEVPETQLKSQVCVPLLCSTLAKEDSTYTPGIALCSVQGTGVVHVYIVQGTRCGVYIVQGTRCGVYIVQGTRCGVYINCTRY